MKRKILIENDVGRSFDKAYLQEHHLPVSSTKSLRRKTIVAHKLSLLNKGETN